MITFPLCFYISSVTTLRSLFRVTGLTVVSGNIQRHLYIYIYITLGESLEFTFLRFLIAAGIGGWFFAMFQNQRLWPFGVMRHIYFIAVIAQRGRPDAWMHNLRIRLSPHRDQFTW
jgi:hypothetical protein